MYAAGVSWADRRGRKRAIFALATATALIVPVSTSGGQSRAPGLAQVIVQALPGGLGQAERAVRAAGGTVTRELTVINGFAAVLPGGTHASLGAADGVKVVTADRPLHVLSSAYTPGTDPGSPTALQNATGAGTYWANGFYGQGVGVAVIDSGVVPEDGLRHNVFYGPDFSPQVADPALKFLDTYGHGTFMASLIAGHADAATRPYSNPANYVGMAPEATLVSVKVADALGNTTESAVVAGVEWVIQHMYDNQLGVNNIRVINLSVGVPDIGYQNDPLAAAIEKAWSACITVVASAGNDGTPGLTLPAADPYAIAVGAVDNHNSATGADDTVAAFSNTGNGKRNPDLVAPGTHLVGLRDAGGFIDNTFGVTGLVGTTLFRGSGTSESAAVVSGAAALIISQHPDLNPDVVKALLMDSAKPLPGASVAQQGAGALNLTAAYNHPLNWVYANWPHATGWDQFTTQQTGGTWSNSVWQSPTYTVASGGEGGTLSASRWTASRWTASRWTGSIWSGSVWSGSVWSGSIWSSQAWS
jgi:serine protease AprX